MGSKSDDLQASLLEGGGGGGDGGGGGEESGCERIGIDEMLRRYAGEFGRWQLRHFVLTSTAWALEALHTMVMIFADQKPAWRCTGPATAACFAAEPCGLEPGSWEWVGGTAGSTVAEWGLICGQKYKVGLVQSGFFLGCMIGAGIFGHLSDSFLGRKGSLTIVCALNAVFGLLTSLAPSYWAYAALRLLTGLSTGGVGLCAFVLATEPVGPSMRGAAGMSTFYFFSAGISAVSAVSYAFPSWRHLYAASSLPSLLFVLAVLPFLSESPRWHLARRDPAAALSVLRSIAAANRRLIPEKTSLRLDAEPPQAAASIVDVVRSPTTRIRLVLAVAINFMCSVVYYGISLNVVNLSADLHVSVLLNAVAEMPAYVLTALMLDRFGRRPLAVGTMWFSAAFCAAGAAAAGAARMGCGIMGIFGMAATYNLLFIYTAELFPTVVRNAALGCATQASQMGAILAPMVVVLGGRAPFVVFGVCGVVGGMLAFYLPETMNRPLYDTMAGIEEGEGKIVVQ